MIHITSNNGWEIKSERMAVDGITKIVSENENLMENAIKNDDELFQGC
jgi:hypothetical protein